MIKKDPFCHFFELKLYEEFHFDAVITAEQIDNKILSSHSYFIKFRTRKWNLKKLWHNLCIGINYVKPQKIFLTKIYFFI